jgi:hypothetical protein
MCAGRRYVDAGSNAGHVRVDGRQQIARQWLYQQASQVAYVRSAVVGCSCFHGCGQQRGNDPSLGQRSNDNEQVPGHDASRRVSLMEQLGGLFVHTLQECGRPLSKDSVAGKRLSDHQSAPFVDQQAHLDHGVTEVFGGECIDAHEVSEVIDGGVAVERGHHSVEGERLWSNAMRAYPDRHGTPSRCGRRTT